MALNAQSPNEIIYNQGGTGGQTINFKVNQNLMDTFNRKSQTKAQASHIIGGLRGFGLNQVHNIESSCCVMHSEEEDDQFGDVIGEA